MQYIYTFGYQTSMHGVQAYTQVFETLARCKVQMLIDFKNQFTFNLGEGWEEGCDITYNELQKRESFERIKDWPEDIEEGYKHELKIMEENNYISLDINQGQDEYSFCIRPLTIGSVYQIF